MSHLRLLIVIAGLVFTHSRLKAEELTWSGKNNSRWSETSSWKSNGSNNSIVHTPNRQDKVVFPAGTHARVIIDGNVEIGDIVVEKGARVEFVSAAPIPFQWTIEGSVDFRDRVRFRGIQSIHFNTRHPAAFIRSSGTQFNGDLVFEGRNEINITDDLQTQQSVMLNGQEINVNGTFIVASTLQVAKKGKNNSKFRNAKFILKEKNIQNADLLRDNTYEVLNGDMQAIGGGGVLNPCGTIPFLLTAVATSDYNGYDVSCNGSSDGTICVNVTGGVGPFNYTWVGGPSTPCYSGVDAGNYIVVVFDMGQGGVSCFTTVVVNEPTDMTLLSWTGTNPSCFGNCDGSAAPVIVGGVPAYTYAWSTGETTPVATNLCNGTNTVQVTDANGCIFDTTFFILIPTPVDPGLVATSTSCFGTCNGMVVSNPSGGNGAPYTYSWSTGSTNDSITGLCSGPYSIVVTDNSGCTGSDTINVTQPISISVTVTSVTNLVCNAVCSGSITVSVSNGTPPYSLQWFNAATGLPIPGATGTTISGLCAGSYYVVVNDNGGCSFQSANINITQPPAINVSVSATNINCNGACNGILTATVSGGTGMLTVTWFNAATGLSVGTGNPLGGRCAGNYFAQVTDANGCIQLSTVVTITEPPALNLSVSHTNILCSGACNGTATATVSGGTGALTVTWHQSPSGTTIGSGTNITGLCAGNYYATLTDANGCTINSAVFSITEPSPLTTSSQGNNDVTCNGACDGFAFYNVSGGTAPLTVTWYQIPGSVPIGQTGDTATNLCPGTYFAQVVDANGCMLQSANQVIVQPPPVNITVSVTSSQCGTTCDGSASASVTGGTPGYSFTWVNATTGTVLPDTTNPISGLCAGSYYVIVTDNHNCHDTSAVFTILATVIVDGSVVGTNVTCNSFCNGVADLTPAGGFTPYTFQWFDQTTGLPIGQSTEDANGLCAGSYYVIATDATGCNSIPLPVTINQPTAINVSITPQNVTCFGACNGQITSVVSGGSPGYTYNWHNAATGLPIGQTGATATGLCAGTYYLQVTDANGCITNSATVTITQPAKITASINTTPVTCFGSCNGTATLTISGGTGPYTVGWSTSANTTPNETGLCAGSHTYTITDANGCTVGPFTYTILSPPNVTATVVNGTIACNGNCTGIVSVNVSGGTSPYTYSWSDPAAQTTPVATGLCSGSFDVTVQDAAGCTYGPFTATVTDPSTLVATISAFTNTSCAPGCSGTATVSISGGTAPYTVLWNDALSQTTLTAIQLCAGNYTVTVKDANGCTTTANVTIGSTAGPSVSLTSTNTACTGTCVGTASATISGGTAPVSISWNNGATTLNINSLCVGTYTATVTDALGCTDVASVNITTTTTPLTAGLSSTLTACGVCSGTATVNPSGGSGTYTYQWNAAAGSQTTQTATALCAGTYSVTVTDVPSGCTGTFTAAVSNAGAESINVDSTAATCAGTCNGTATVSFVCGDAPCTVLWNDPAAQTTATATGLCAGTYGVTVTNASGCVAAATIQVTEPQPIVVNATGTNALCNGACTGQGTAAPTGGNGLYTYSWNDPAAQTAFTAFNLCPGSYIVTVTDSTGCSAQGTVNISQPPAFTFTTSSNNVSCPGLCNGSATAFPTGGAFPYTYSWDDPAGQTSQMATGLCAGTFNVTIFDNNGCTAGPQSVNVNQPVATLITISSTNPFCGGQCNGTATANVSGGTAPYTYLWNDPAAQTTQTATNLCPGNYTVTVTDANGCVLGTANITITPVPNLSVSVSPSNVTCFGLCDGLLNAVVSGGTAPYSAQWNDPASQANTIATALCPGSYTVIITDANGCTTSAVQSVGQPTALSSTLSITDPNCNGSCNGTATITPSGGTGAISILWSSGQSTPTASGLCAGNYFVSITDANGCNQQTNFQVNDPPAFTFLTGTSPANCGVCNGSASISPIGGTPPYTYLWDAAAASQTTMAALNLCAGIYGATVTDAQGCILSTFIPVSNIGGESLTVSTVDATCPDVCNGSATASTPCVNGPCSFAWFQTSTGASLGVTTSSISGLCPGDYIARVINTLNCSTLVAFTVGSPDTIDVTPTITQPLCNGSCTGVISVSATGGTGTISFQWDAAAGGGTSNTVSGLCAGSYDLIATDAAGCDDTLTYTIAPPLPINVNVNNSSTFCSGTCTGVATAIVSGGVPGYTYLWNDPGAQTTSTASGLCNGSYTVTVTDANGCTASSSGININQPVLLTAVTSSTPTVCAGDCNGTGTVTISGGSSPYNVQWNDPLNQTSATAVNLCTGSYDVTVTDINNCTAGPQTVNITAPAMISATFVVTNTTCNGLCTGAMTINASGGNGSYIYSIDNGATFQSSSTFVNLCAGAYQVIIKDANNCASTTLVVNVNEPTPVSANTSSLNADCGTNNGAASVFPIGGTPGYTINWFDVVLNPLGQTTNTAINLGAGIYTAFIQDNNGCQYQVSVTVSNNNAPTTSAVTTSPDCHGNATGAVDVTVTSGTSPFTYGWFPGGQTTQDLTNVGAGTYILQVTDGNGCIAFNTFVLTEPSGFTNNISTTAAACGQCNGTAVATVTGGTGALSLVWSNLQTGTTASGLCGGAYSVLVTDANGCNEQFNVTVGNTGGPTPVINVTNPLCYNNCTGTATVSAVGGTGPYSYLWIETGDTITSITNLCPGVYSVEVKDSAGCVAFTAINVTSPPQITDSITVVPASCGVCNGSVIAFAGGQAPFTFQWGPAAGSATTASVSSLCMGLYSLVITDANGCKDTTVAMLPNVNAPAVVATPTDVSCYGNCNGSATASGTGGNPPLTFNWFDNTLTSILTNAASISSLCPGNYLVQVTDAFGCGSFNGFTIGEPDSLVASFNFIQDETCFNSCDGIMSVMPVNGTLPFTYNWTTPAGLSTSMATNLCDGGYTVNITDANGCALTLTDSVGQPAPILMNLDSTDASCSTIADGAVDATVTGGAGGFTYSWTGPSGFTAFTEDISAIYYGTYILTATDANGCSLTDTIVVNAILIADANAGPDTVLCASGTSLFLTGIGTPGTNYTWTDTMGTVLSTTTTLTIPAGTTAGEYIFTVNNMGCIDSDTVDVTINPLPPVNAGPDQETVAGQPVTLGGSPTTTAGNSISWQPSAYVSPSSAPNPTATPDTTTGFVVQVTDANGCVAFDTVIVSVYPKIIFPNGFSPNGDGANDTWILDFIEFFPDVEVSVFNRWGQPVFTSKGYSIPWDGTYNGKAVTIGTYYYVILLNHPLYPDAFTGPLTILR